MSRKRSTNSRGGALLAVLWLSAALAAIAFSVATTVRGEIERASTLSESMRTHYLAAGGIERALLWCRFGSRGGPQLSLDVPRMDFDFPAGRAIVEVIPETARLDINRAQPQALMALALALGADPLRAEEIAVAIVHWRSPGAGPLDAYYLGLGPTFRPRHASVQDVEELLYVKGMTPDLFHGNYVRDAAGRLVRLGAFKDCVSPWGSVDQFDVNTVEPALMVAAGVAPEAARQIAGMRRIQPVVNEAQLNQVRAIAGIGASKLRRGGGNSIYTLRATARLRLPDGRFSDLSKTIAATVKFAPQGSPRPYYILRWDETATSEVSQWR
ncbi:MAG: general secretion pathway protein GspK [Acidobacteria bacterium]|nr:general secretion pathway protein GspK [Acidobacteriota bacterium]